MILEQLYLGCLAQASYFIADLDSKTAVVVDPRRDVDLYVELAEKHGVRIEHVFLTHFHADFLAGHIELQARSGAQIHIGAKAGAEFDFVPMEDGAELVLGPRVRLSFLETPGHTPESVCIQVFDRKKSDAEPHALLTGDTLFIGDVGRPDLMASVGFTAVDLAGWMFDSLQNKVLPLPDDTVIYPGHGAGSMCGKNLSSETFSTLGVQRTSNYALQFETREQFVAALTANQPKQPDYFGYDAELNRKLRPTLDEKQAQAMQAMQPEDVQRLQNAGAQLLDTRSAEAFAKAHWPGSVNVGLDGKFATWCGTVLKAGQKIVLLCEPATEAEAVTRLGRIGFDFVQGYLAGGVQAWADSAALASPDSVGQWQRVEARQLAERQDKPFVLDVRNPGERENGFIEGSAGFALGGLRSALADDIESLQLPRDREIVVSCQSGYRSSVAASMLRQAGFENVSDLRGGYLAWAEAFASQP